MPQYFVYYRKSSEAEDRQILSIDSQISELKRFAAKGGIKILAILTEAKSAKAPGRPILNSMMERLYKGEANGILCWKPDRLARNSVDEVAKFEMAVAIRELGLKPIILHEQASGGLTVIEKIEKYTDVGFAVVLYTPCDIGVKRAASMNLKSRARQNVVFEHGYLIARLRRSRVTAFVKGDIETPTDISGVIFVDLDANGVWKIELARELKAVGYI